MRQAVAVLIATAVSALMLMDSVAHAGEFHGPPATAATFGAGVLAGIVCWTVELASGEQEHNESAEEFKHDFDRRGWFVGAQGVYALDLFDTKEEEASIRATRAQFKVDLNVRDTGGLNFRAGRRCHRRFSVEVEVEWLDDFDGDLIFRSEKINDVSYSPIVGSVNLKGYLLTGRYQPYFLFGVGAMSVKTKSRDTITGDKRSRMAGLFVLRFGAGIDLYATRNWVVTAETDYVYSATSIDVLDYLTVGLGFQYRF